MVKTHTNTVFLAVLPQHTQEKCKMEAAAIAAEQEAVAITMDTILQWIAGFDNAGTRNRLLDEGLNSFDSLRSLDSNDIARLDESFGRRSVADGRSIFGVRCTGLLIGLVHWVQDHGRISKASSLDEF